jgi:eukaryotic-like serine/threonine-protein kinase
MNSERWRRVQAIFHEATELAPHERVALLAARCGGDGELRSTVEAMLAADADSSALAGAIPVELERALHEEANSRAPGDRVGVYRIIGELGRGGMGVVYLAERDDVGKRVALKLGRGALAGPGDRERFLQERRVLARLEHPHIARLFDAGVTENGTPWFAMERVEGEPVTTYCDRHRLTIRERLAVFTQICSAVQHAHQSLVVHRDLKPSNILVSEPAPGSTSPHATLLDFGIAALLREREPGEARSPEGGVRVMTPGYAAPEQFRGEPVTTAADVYALGILLRELVSGAPPRSAADSAGDRAWWRSSGGSAPSCSASLGPIAAPPADNRVRLEAAARARRTTPAALRRVLRGDLGAVIRKAMQPEPACRYPSVQGLLDDVDRFRQHRPVSSRTPTLPYRATKFARRHRTALLTASIVLMLLVATGASLVRQRSASARGQLEAARAEDATELLSQLFDAIDPRQTRGDLVSAPTVLAWGERGVDELRNYPAMQAQLLTRITQAYVGLGRYDRARETAERALALRRSLPQGDPAELATSLWYLALVRMDEARFEEGEQLFRESLSLRRDVHSPGHPEIVKGLVGLGMLLATRGEWAEAERLSQEALALDAAGLADVRLPIPGPRIGLAFVLVESGRHAEAEAIVREGIAAERARSGDDHPFVLMGMTLLARSLHGQGRLDEAARAFRDLLATSTRVLGEEHPRFSVFLQHYASLLTDRGEMAAAERAARRGLEIQQRVLSPDHYWSVPALTLLGRILTQTDRAAEAEPLLRDAVRIGELRLPPRHVELARARLGLATGLVALGHRVEADPLFTAAEGVLRGWGVADATSGR